MALTTERGAASRRPPASRQVIDPTTYTSPERLRLEFEHVWSATWQLACLESDLPQVGDFYEYVIGDSSILIVRTEQGLRAYHNLCAHRGRRIKTGCGHAERLQCPYHLWTWSLDGSLEDVPERDTYCPFDDKDAALQAVRVEQWQQWVFVNLAADADPLREYLGEVVEILAPYRLDRQYKWWSRSTTVRANWKAAVDAFNEAYHARGLHPESVTFINYTDYEIRLLGIHSLMILPFGIPDATSVPLVPDYQEMLDAMEWSFAAFGEDTSLVEFLRLCHLEPGQHLRELVLPLMKAGMAQASIDVSDLDDPQITDDWHFHLFPNVIINCFSFGYWLFRFVPHPTDPDECTIDMWYFHRVPDTVDELPPADAHQVIPMGESCGAVMDQDLGNIPIQQAGLRSPAAPGHRLSSLEARIVHMHEVLDSYIDR